MTPADTILDSPIHTGRGHHPHLTITDKGCHVWLGSRYGPCFKHGTIGCCLVMHASPAAQRAFNQPRCETCGVFVGGLAEAPNRCRRCA